MKNDYSAKSLAFDLFLDAVKRKDKRQFAYFNLYFNIAHADEQMHNEDNNELEMM